MYLVNNVLENQIQAVPPLLVQKDTFRTRHTFTKYTNYTFLGFNIILVLDIVIGMGSEKHL